MAVLLLYAVFVSGLTLILKPELPRRLEVATGLIFVGTVLVVVALMSMFGGANDAANNN